MLFASHASEMMIWKESVFDYLLFALTQSDQAGGRLNVGLEFNVWLAGWAWNKEIITKLCDCVIKKWGFLVPEKSNLATVTIFKIWLFNLRIFAKFWFMYEKFKTLIHSVLKNWTHPIVLILLEIILVFLTFNYF